MMLISDESPRMSFERSRQILSLAKETIPAGADSAMRVLPYQLPLVIASADGVVVTDVDGNELIDLNMGYGPLIFGHRPSLLVDAIKAELDLRGTTLGFPHELSHETAHLIRRSFPSIDMLRFSSTGTEVNQTAVRLAKAYTGRQKLVVFEGHYHGSTDHVFHKYHASAGELEGLSSPWNAIPGTKGMAGAPYNTAVLPWNNPTVLSEFLRSNYSEIAAVIMEPVMGNAAVIPPNPGYLEEVRALTNQYGIVLIFDEVITGFRIARGGAQERYGIEADITTLSKAMGGGVPISAVGGRRDIMQLLATNAVFHGGAYSGSPLCLSAALATQKHFESSASEIYSQFEARSQQFAKGLRSIFAKVSVPVVVQSVGAMFSFTFVKNDKFASFSSYREICEGSLPERYISFQHELQRTGVFIHPNQYEPLYLSTRHTESVIGEILARIESAAQRLRWD